MTSSSSKPVSVLFVCLGNICRSPLAEAVFHHLAQDEAVNGLVGQVDSAGTGAYHVGNRPDPRTMATLRRHGIHGYKHAARQLEMADFKRFDYILVMDEENMKNTQRLRNRVEALESNEGLAQLALFGSYSENGHEEVVDPYYGADDGFEIAYHQMIRFSKAFLDTILRANQATGTEASAIIAPSLPT